MTADIYRLCPGGTGKKVKFCCSDMHTELDKLERMLDGDQRLAALDFATKLEGKFPGRACLLAYKIQLQGELGEVSGAKATIRKFVELHPRNPVALAELAMEQTEAGELPAAMQTLQDSLEESDSEILPSTFDAIGLLATRLVQSDYIFAGIALLRVQSALGGNQPGSPVAQFVSHLTNDANVPLLLKSTFRLVDCPPGAKWQESFDAAKALQLKLQWRASATKFAELARQLPRVPEIWKNLAILRGWLAEDAASATAWRELAKCAPTLDDAVEAEAMAQLIEESDAKVARVRLTYDVSDLPALEARLMGNSHMMRVHFPREPDEDSPPHSSFYLLDRTNVSSSPEITIDQIPVVVGTVVLYGKQTDREARAEWSSWRDANFAAARQTFEQACGELITGTPQEDEVSKVSALAHVLSWQWRMPDDVSEDRRRKLIAEQKGHLMTMVWPDLPQPALENKSPRQAAGDEKLRIKVLAQILLLECSIHSLSEIAQYDALRKNLGLPLPEPLKLKPGQQVSPTRLMRADVEELPDDELQAAAAMTIFLGATSATENLIAKVEKRPTLAASNVRIAGLLEVAAHCDDLTQSMDILRRAREAAKQTGVSCVAFDFRELNLWYLRDNFDEVQRLFKHISETHGREQGVAEQMYRWMASVGIVGPDGQLRGAQQEETPALVVPGDSGDAGKIWTPEGETAAAGGKKLWMPGMD